MPLDIKIKTAQKRSAVKYYSECKRVCCIWITETHKSVPGTFISAVSVETGLNRWLNKIHVHFKTKLRSSSHLFTSASTHKPACSVRAVKSNTVSVELTFIESFQIPSKINITLTQHKIVVAYQHLKAFRT